MNSTNSAKRGQMPRKNYVKVVDGYQRHLVRCNWLKELNINSRLEKIKNKSKLMNQILVFLK